MYCRKLTNDHKQHYSYCNSGVDGIANDCKKRGQTAVDKQKTMSR